MAHKPLNFFYGEEINIWMEPNVQIKNHLVRQDLQAPIFKHGFVHISYFILQI